MRRHHEPKDLAEAAEKTSMLPPGDEERFAGYGVMAAPFVSGDILAMRRFPASSLGHGYTSVWHRDPQGAWMMWTDLEPLEACPRYFGAALAHAERTAIDVRWPGPRTLEVSVPEHALSWHVELQSTATTRFLNRMSALMPEGVWHSPAMLAAVAAAARALLHTGKMSLSGHVPNGQTFIANPMTLWEIGFTSASLAGRDFGPAGPVPQQAHLADFWIPQRGLFAIGNAFFEPADAARHHLVAQSESAGVST